MPITDPTHPYYAYDDSVPLDINKAHPDLAMLGDDGSPPPELRRMSSNELEDIARRSESLSAADKATVEHMAELQKIPGIKSRKSFMINAPWKND